MILGNLNDSDRINALHPLFSELFAFVKSNDLLQCDLGRIELKGSDLFINNVEATLVNDEKQPLEVHRDYIDVHIPLSTTERIGWKALCDCSALDGEFDVENDFALYREAPSTVMDVKVGEFLVVFPEDAHAPILGNGTLRKLIAKVKIYE